VRKKTIKKIRMMKTKKMIVFVFVIKKKKNKNDRQRLLKSKLYYSTVPMYLMGFNLYIDIEFISF